MLMRFVNADQYAYKYKQEGCIGYSISCNMVVFLSGYLSV